MREVQDLRALKLLAPPGPHMYMRAPPPTTLTMCPSCERIAPSGKPLDGNHRATTMLPRPAPPNRPWGLVPVLPVLVETPPSSPPTWMPGHGASMDPMVLTSK